MMTKQNQFGLSAIVVALLGVAACSKPDAPSDDLSRDITMAAAPSLTLAPQAGQTDVVSAAEQAPEARKAPKPSAPTVRPKAVRHAAIPQPVAVASVPTVQEAPVAEAPQPVPQPAAQPQRREAQRPVQQHAPQGGYKTEAQVFRDAPFPILP